MPNWKKVIVSGSDASLNFLNVATNVVAQSFTGSLFGTASFATSASQAQNSVSSSFATSASYALSSSYAFNATSASYAISSSQAISSSYATSASQAISSSYALSSSYAFNATSASYAISASQAISSSFATSASYAISSSFSQNASDILIYVKNSSGAQINKGKVVRITGAVGDNPLIATASYENDNNSANTLGITYENIPNDSFGYVMTEGTLLGINTNDFTAGQLIYLGATGSIIGTAPVAPLHAVRLGEVLRVQVNNGSIYVRIDNGYELGELHDVKDTTTTSSYGDLLVKSGSIWINSKQLTGSYGLTGSLTATSLSASSLILTNNATITGSLTILQNLTVLGSASITYISQSTLNVETNLITVNANTPSVRFGGLAVIDSGSLPQVSGSWLFDSQQNRWIFLHQQTAGSALTSSIGIMGPETYNNIGNETQITQNRVVKGYSGISGEHVGDSQISDDGTTVSIPGILTIGATVSSSESNLFLGPKGTNEGGQLTLQPGTSYTSGAMLDNYVDRLRILKGTATTSTAEVASWNLDTNQMVLPGYQSLSSFPAIGLSTKAFLGIDSSGNVITVNSISSSLGVGTTGSAVVGRIDAANDVVAFATSDENLKKNIKPIKNAIEKIEQIGGYTFEWKKDKKNIHGFVGKDVGVIAQEVEAVLPEVVTTRENGYKAVRYEKIIPLLIEAIKEQQNRINELENLLKQTK